MREQDQTTESCGVKSWRVKSWDDVSEDSFRMILPSMILPLLLSSCEPCGKPQTGAMTSDQGEHGTAIHGRDYSSFDMAHLLVPASPGWDISASVVRRDLDWSKARAMLASRASHEHEPPFSFRHFSRDTFGDASVARGNRGAGDGRHGASARHSGGSGGDATRRQCD